MLLTATCTWLEVNEIYTNLAIEEKNFIIVHSFTNYRLEIIFSV